MAEADDLYSALIGGVPSDPQRQAALAQILRNQGTLGQLGMASGDRVLSPLGRNLQTGAESGAEKLGVEREKQQQLNTQEHWRNIEEKHYNDQLAYQKQNAEAERANRLTIAKLLSQNRLDVQQEKNQGKAATGGKAIPASNIKDLEALRDTAMDVDEATSGYKAGYGHLAFPGGRPLANTLAQAGIGTDSSKEAQNWWAQYGRNFTLDEMHRRFGARLSPQEMARFEKYHIDPNMTDDQIKQNLGQISDFFHNMVGRHVNDFMQGGYNSGMLNAILSGSKGTSVVPASPGDKYLQQIRGANQSQPQQQPISQPSPVIQQQPSPMNLFSGVMGGGY